MKQRVLIGAVSLAAAAAVVAVGAMVAGCSRETVEPTTAKEIIPIVIANDVGVESDVQRESRAPLDGSQATTLYFLRADQGADDTYGAYGLEVIEGSIPAGSGARTITFNPKQYYQLNGKKTKMIGFYNMPPEIESTYVYWDLDGSQDLMTAAVQEGSQTSAMPAFTFKHKMAQLQFWVYADSKNTSDYWGPMSQLSVRNQSGGAEFRYAYEKTGALSFGTANQGHWVTGSGLAIPVGASNMVKFGDPVMINPITNADLPIELTNDIHVDYQIMIPKATFMAGKAYKVVLRFTDMGIVVEPLTIATWHRAMQIKDVDM